MKHQFTIGTRDLSDKVIELVRQEPAKLKSHERRCALPTFSMIDPKGGK